MHTFIVNPTYSTYIHMEYLVIWQTHTNVNGIFVNKYSEEQNNSFAFTQ